MYQQQQYPQQNQYIQPENQGFVQNPQMYPQQYPQQMQQNMPQQVMLQQPVLIQNQPMQPQIGLNILATLPSVYIKQKLEMWEVLTGCETQNQYTIFPGDANGQRMHNPIFKAKERSECCQRIMFSGNCRSFEINVSSKIPVSRNDYVDFEKFYFLKMRRPYKCTCLCFERPIMEIYSLEQGQEKFIGKIVNPFSCCEIILEIYNKDNGLDYIVKGDQCQLGILCRGFPCDSCQEARFNVLDKNGNILKPLFKRSAGCLKAMMSDVDEFSVIFPDGASVYQKGLLMSAALLLDYLHFEDNQSDQNRNKNSIRF